MYLCIYVSVCLSYVSMNLCISVSAYLCVYVSMHLSHSLSLSFSSSLCLSIDQSTKPSIYLPVHLYITYLRLIYLPTYLRTSLSLYISISLSLYLSVYLSIYPSIYLSSNLPVFSVLVMHPCFHQNSTDIFMHIPVVCLIYADIFVCLYVCIEVVHCNASKRKSGNIMKLNGLPLCLQARVHACFGRMYACMCLSLHRSLYLFM